jgi:type IX secretion system PorP/SprF family membrane protein
MNIKKFCTILIICQVSVFAAKAQDPYFSQYFMSPMTSNPALVGRGITDTRVLSNFRSQWWGTGIPAFRTNSISIEKRVAVKKLPEDEMAFGLSMDNDASNGGLLKKNYVTLAAAFNKRLSKNSFLGAGITLSYSNLTLDQSKFLYQTQFGSMGFLRTLPTYDPLLIANKEFVNTDAGINYSYEDDKWGLNIGVAGFHLAKNKQGVLSNGDYSNQVRYATNASIFKKYKGGDELHFVSRYDNQGVNSIFTLGSIYKIKIPGEHPVEKLNLGLFDRFNDSIYPFIGFESASWFAGFSYDIINSELKTSYNSVQSMELTFGWQIAAKKAKLTHNRMVSY